LTSITRISPCNWKAVISPVYRSDSRNDTDLIFWGDAKDNVSGERKPYDFTEAWEEARNRVGLPNLHFHDLRHEAVSRLVEVGLGDQEVAAISGHKTM
jgi:integrase